ncbi:MAG TPA: hypothetical protein VG754_03400, partial [Verrucomicrobiae bacterium]|nr:hypothetical protein [Verrucomicrobiae bacterium]
MAPSNPVQERRSESAPLEADEAKRRARFLKAAFCVWVILLAIYQFSENTADPDLWGHVTFGQEILHSHAIPKTEIYSWTSAGQPWINHELLAEIFLGGAHAMLGGSGLLLLKMAVGLLTFALCLRMALADMKEGEQWIAWGFAALAVVEISFGFSARPQIFTALCLTLELMLLRRIHAGAPLWALALPPLFIFWINTHGGALAGVGLLAVTAAATTGQFLFSKKFKRDANEQTPTLKIVFALWLALVGVIGALFCNPWGGGLVRFLIESVSWLRPEIQEWNPTPVNWDHAAMFMLMALGVFAWAFTRRRRAWWEAAVCAAFAVLALRSVRNVPLFALVALALVPRQLADALARFRRFFARIEMLWQRADIQNFAAIMLVLTGVGIGAATFTLHKEHPFTMEAPRAEYPVSAISFIQEHGLRGKLFVFFDWGEMTIFHLPDCPPSIDPRLDTCYSRALIAAHWKFYNGEPCDEKVLDPFAADLALLPVKLAGALTLAHHPGWKAVYYDETAVLLVRDVTRFPGLQGLALPVEGAKTASLGRAAFADRSPRWK